jgi:hypothetical protein
VFHRFTRGGVTWSTRAQQRGLSDRSRAGSKDVRSAAWSQVFDGHGDSAHHLLDALQPNRQTCANTERAVPLQSAGSEFPCPAEQLFEPSLAFDQRQIAQIVAIVFDQVEGVQLGLRVPASVAQRMEVRRLVVADNHDLDVDQVRRGLDAEYSVNMPNRGRCT